MFKAVNIRLCIDVFMSNFLHMVVVTDIGTGSIFRDNLILWAIINEWHNHNTSAGVTVTDFSHFEWNFSACHSNLNHSTRQPLISWQPFCWFQPEIYVYDKMKGGCCMGVQVEIVSFEIFVGILSCVRGQGWRWGGTCDFRLACTLLECFWVMSRFLEVMLYELQELVGLKKSCSIHTMWILNTFTLTLPTFHSIENIHLHWHNPTYRSVVLNQQYEIGIPKGFFKKMLL